MAPSERREQSTIESADSKDGGIDEKELNIGRPVSSPANSGLEITAIDDEKATALQKEHQDEVKKVSTKGQQTEKKEKENSHPAGWTIMRPLRMRAMGGKSKKDGGATTNANGEAVMRSSSEDDADATKDFKTLETTGTGGSRGLGEVEVMTDMRSDDGLLEDENENERFGVAPTQRANAHEAAVDGVNERQGQGDTTVYKVYKRRWFGLVQLVLLNIIVSWDWLSFSASSKTASEYYDISESAINWLSTGFLFAFVVASPFTIYTLHRGGPKPSIVTASVLILLGNWIRYGATRSGEHGNFGGLMFGQILTGIAQPFVLSAPTRYSDLWFTNRGRVAATAVMSLANPFGGALAQLINPFWATKPSEIPNLVLYVAIISSIASIPAFFIPSHPPTPVSHSGTVPKNPLIPSLKILLTSPEFYMIMIPFVFYVGLFNSISSLLNQMLEPYSFSESDAGIAGALLIVVGLVTSAITSPIIDKTKSFLLAIKLQVPIVALAYLAFTFAPQTRTLAAPYAILSILGAASFSLVPVVLEYIIEITHPVSPEVTSTILWTGGQLLGGIFIVVSDALKAPGGERDGPEDDGTTRPPGNLYKALVFQCVMGVFVVPFPLALGLFGRGNKIKMRRIEADRERERLGLAGGGREGGSLA
ncbi:hypothetical protein HYFRA_00005870 [Hymenoscyphus fraxineus]|uniref:MFS general substrate transporter n=1 Tax=Hymenoscyphus fraxineus TaxID=746836 RepID=A0A9N9KU12_9HELO|nr:hypothetical protein HYFRA_00005870 [Hymenoscyphus fraxineus]